MLKIILSIVVFSIELIMLGSFAWFGYLKGNSTTTKYALAIILPVTAIILWGYFAAPRSYHRLAMPYLALFRLSMFLITSIVLYACGQTKFAITLAAISAATQLTGFVSEDLQ